MVIAPSVQPTANVLMTVHLASMNLDLTVSSAMTAATTTALNLVPVSFVTTHCASLARPSNLILVCHVLITPLFPFKMTIVSVKLDSSKINLLTLVLFQIHVKHGQSQILTIVQSAAMVTSYRSMSPSVCVNVQLHLVKMTLTVLVSLLVAMPNF